MIHNLQKYIITIKNFPNYKTPLVNAFGERDYDDISQFTGLTSPFDSREAALEFWQTPLSKLGFSELLDYWNTTMLPGQEHNTHTHTEHGWDVDDTITTYTAVLFCKYDLTVHKPTYFADNPLKINEYKPIVAEGDCLVFPSNIYHRAPLNNSSLTRITSMCVFTISTDVSAFINT